MLYIFVAFVFCLSTKSVCGQIQFAEHSIWLYIKSVYWLSHLVFEISVNNLTRIDNDICYVQIVSSTVALLKVTTIQYCFSFYSNGRSEKFYILLKCRWTSWWNWICLFKEDSHTYFGEFILFCTKAMAVRLSTSCDVNFAQVWDLGQQVPY